MKRRILSEGTQSVEPKVVGRYELSFRFAENQTEIRRSKERAKREITQYIQESLPIIKEFLNTGKLPPVFRISVGTSHTGSFEDNYQVAKGRMQSIYNLCMEVLESLGIRKDVAYKLIVMSNQEYTPSKIDRDFYDPEKVTPKGSERTCYLSIMKLRKEGLDRNALRGVEQNLRGLGNKWFNTDEEGIVNAICKCKTMSDLQELNSELQDQGGLEGYINHNITGGITPMGSDTKEREKIIQCINRAAGSQIAKSFGDMGVTITTLKESRNRSKRKIRLTESELVKLVNRLIKEERGKTPPFASNPAQGGQWYDSQDYATDEPTSYSEEREFGPEEYEDFMEFINDCETSWCLKTKKFYDHYANVGKIKVRK